jgi:pseudaminic acid synthase
MFKIHDRQISADSPTYIIAELSANHKQDFDLALETIHAMKEAGADAVKLQTYRADTITLDSEKPLFRTRPDSLWAGRKLYELYEEAYTPWEWHASLKEEIEKLDMHFFSSPFDHTAVDFLDELGVPAFKIASLEITDIPLIRYAASKGKPLIISTGIARPEDIELALQSCKEEGNQQVALLKCTSAYPTPLEDANLQNIPWLQATYGCVVGLSDHTLGTLAPTLAVALGARIIEKHFILDRKLGGVDAAFSLDAKEFKQMVDAVRDTEKALGQAEYELGEKGEDARVSARSLIVTEDIPKGAPFTKENLRSLRPGAGLPPRFLPEILGKTAAEDIERGTPLSWEMVG